MGDIQAFGTRPIWGQGTHHVGGAAAWCLGLVEDPQASPAGDQQVGDGEEKGRPDL